MTKKLAIIGGGIAGLAAGIYGRLNGFDTEIYEMHSIPGGECTGWERKGYYFDGCIHWLVGSKPNTPLNDIWRELGGLDDSIGIVNHDYFYCHEENGQQLYLYANPDKLERHLLELAPADSKRIRHLCRALKAMASISMPTEKPFDQMNLADFGKMMLGMAPSLRYLRYFEKRTIAEYAQEFTSPIVRSALVQLIPPHHKATALVASLASLGWGDSGWPLGGSLAFAQRIARRYQELGGKAFYNCRVSKVLIDEGTARGITLSDGRQVVADYVISTADGHWTHFDLLEGKYLDDTLRQLYSDPVAYPTHTSVQVSLGINCDLSHRPHLLFMPTQAPLDCGGVHNSYVGLRHFGYDTTLMPTSKSVITVTSKADYDWWKAKHQDPIGYLQEKERIAQEIIALVEQRYPETKDEVEVYDVATPVTYARYCNAWRGSWMSWAATPQGKVRYHPGKLPGLEGFFHAGQWTMPPGGLPTAVVTGRWVIQRICGHEKQKFRSSAD